MSARRTTALVIDGAELQALAEMARIAIALRQRNGLDVPPEWRAVRDAATGCPSPDAGQNTGGWVGTEQAAQMLGKSLRQTRRLADRLGARRIGGRLVFPLAELS